MTTATTTTGVVLDATALMVDGTRKGDSEFRVLCSVRIISIRGAHLSTHVLLLRPIPPEGDDKYFTSVSREMGAFVRHDVLVI